MIYITCGTCGTSQGYKSKNDGAITLPANEERRLVNRGVAEYVTRPIINRDDDAESVSVGSNTPGTKDGAQTLKVGVAVPETLDIVDGHFTEESLRQMTNANLAKIGADLGLDVKKCKNKDDFVELLSEIELDIAETEDDDDENPPNLDDDTVVE